jgi:hypothetical protein
VRANGGADMYDVCMKADVLMGSGGIDERWTGRCVMQNIYAHQLQQTPAWSSPRCAVRTAGAAARR